MFINIIHSKNVLNKSLEVTIIGIVLIVSSSKELDSTQFSMYEMLIFLEPCTEMAFLLNLIVKTYFNTYKFL